MNFWLPIIIWVICFFGTIVYCGYQTIVNDILEWYFIPMILGTGIGGAFISVFIIFTRPIEKDEKIEQDTV